MTKTLNLTQIPPLHKTSFNGSALQLSNIEVNQDYLDEWNENCKDFVVLSKNGEILRNTLYRVGGLNNPKVGIDKYFMLLKYTEDLYTIDFIKKCYPKKTKKEQEKHLKHKNMNIDKMIQQWEEKHSSLLNEYSKGNANNEVMQLYRSQMKNVLDFINELKQVKNNFVLADVSGRSELLIDFCSSMQFHFIATEQDSIKKGVDEYLKSINSH